MSPTERLAQYIATIARGPARARPLTEAEAEDAMRIILAEEAAPEQLGALLMLLRYRGESAPELNGLLRACTDSFAEGFATAELLPDLDWPSYGAGKTRIAPWFVLAALALGQSGLRVLMHGSNEFGSGQSVPAALASLGLPLATTAAQAEAGLSARGFAYIPLESLHPRLAGLLGLRRLLGLRSPLNTVARLLNPGAAPAGVDGVFHPAYITTHLQIAALQNRPRLLVLKGGGGEAERNPFKPATLHLHQQGAPPAELTLPALLMAPATASPEPPIEALWSGQAPHAELEARVIGTIEMALLALGRQGPEEAAAQAAAIWQQRRPNF